MSSSDYWYREGRLKKKKRLIDFYPVLTSIVVTKQLAESIDATDSAFGELWYAATLECTIMSDWLGCIRELLKQCCPVR